MNWSYPVLSWDKAVELLSRNYKASVTSWWRTAAHNAKLPGSSPKSAHLRGEAIDVVYDGAPPPIENLENLGFLVRRENDHDHLELRQLSMP